MTPEQATALIGALAVLVGAVGSVLLQILTYMRAGRVESRVDGQHSALVAAGIIKDSTIAAQATALGQTPTQALQFTPDVQLTANPNAPPAPVPIPVEVIANEPIPVTETKPSPKPRLRIPRRPKPKA